MRSSGGEMLWVVSVSQAVGTGFKSVVLLDIKSSPVEISPASPLGECEQCLQQCDSVHEMPTLCCSF